MKKSELITAATELNKVLGLEPKIDVKLPVDKLKKLVKEAATLVEPTDKITPVTKSVIDELNGVEAPAKKAPAKKAPAKKAEPVEEEDDDEEEVIEEEEEDDDFDDDDEEETPEEDDEELVVEEGPPIVKPSPKKAKDKAPAKAKAPATPKGPRLTRPVVLAQVLQGYAGKKVALSKVIEDADAIYVGRPNMSETMHYLKTQLFVLELFGVVTQKGETLTFKAV